MNIIGIILEYILLYYDYRAVIRNQCWKTEMIPVEEKQRV
jgi:hypothetical protein